MQKWKKFEIGVIKKPNLISERNIQTIKKGKNSNLKKM